MMEASTMFGLCSTRIEDPWFIRICVKILLCLSLVSVLFRTMIF